MKAWRMNIFISKSIARMVALWEKFFTTASCLFGTFFLATITLFLVSQNSSTVSALLSLFVFFMLYASLPQMIRFLTTRTAEILLAIRTSYSMLAHVLCSSFVNLFAIIIFNIVIDFTLNKLN